MTYTFKLSRRLAIAHLTPIFAALALTAGCTSSELTSASDFDSSATSPEYAKRDPARGGRGRGRNKDGESPTLTKIVVSPDTTSVKTKETARFAAVGVMSDGSKVETPVVWSATGGTIDSTGLYTAGSTGGTFRVSARSTTATVSDTATVAVQSSSSTPSVTEVTISPANASLESGATLQFSATAKRSDGSSTSDGITFQATGGTIAADGRYTAGSTAGTYRVIASASGKADTASVAITSTSPTPTPGDPCVRELSVSSISALNTAVNGAQAGDCITLSSGNYSSGTITWSRSGTASKPIVIRGRGATIQLASNAAIYVDGSHLKIRGLRVTGGIWGFHLRGAVGVRLDSVQVDGTAQWAVGFRMGSHHDTLSNSRIFDTGRAQPEYGEGAYIGGYANNTCCTADEEADDMAILGNTFGPNVRAESVDISRGADRVIMTGNTIDGRGTRYINGQTNGLVSLRGNGHRVADNVMRYGAPNIVDVYEGTGSVIERNTMALYNQWNYSSPYAVRKTGGSVVVRCNNVVTDVQAGSAYNVTCQ